MSADPYCTAHLRKIASLNSGQIIVGLDWRILNGRSSLSVPFSQAQSNAISLRRSMISRQRSFNTWMSAGAEPEPREGPGLDEIVLTVSGDPGLADARERLERSGAHVDEAEDGAVITATPDRVPVRLEEGQ